MKEGEGRPTMDLPLEIEANALSRLPIKTAVHCKCVCKRWRSVLSEPYFVDLHLSRLPAGVIVQERNILKIGELNEKSDQHDIHQDPLMRFQVPFGSVLSGSVNGLIILRDKIDAGAARICNLVTREYILLPYNKNIEKSIPIIYNYDAYDLSGYGLASYGFGYVEASNEYKVVHFYEVCQQDGIYANGNLHWLACVQKDRPNDMVCTFDLEKESCRLTASAPQVGGYVDYRTLGVLGGCLCICDNRTDSELVIWVMKDYGVKESWSKDIIIQDVNLGLRCRTFYPLKVLKDGSILIMCSATFLFTYHPGTKVWKTNIWKIDDCFKGYLLTTFHASVYVPSFISLKSFMLENVSVF
ncbi:F-box protein CPR1-like [Apium graveolens]|uniref:F-box protein CPR1-like n=1 Tax=Apium graveolens TaxID=4045 RepID=UPI003D7AEB68